MIKVRAKDGTVQLGGEFNSTKSFVKLNLKGKFNPSTKEWAVDLPSKEIADKFHGSIDFPDGNHRTKYRNTYSQMEITAMNETDKAQSGIHKSYSSAYSEVMSWLKAELEKITSKEVALKLASLIDSGKYEEEIEIGVIQFSSKEKEMAIEKIYNEYWDKMGEVIDNEQLAKDEARIDIFEQYGVK